MLFNSFQFLLFFPIVFITFFSLPHRFRHIFLLLASYYFYMCWKAEYLILIVASTLIDYFVSLEMGKRKKKEERRKFLWLSILVNLGILFSFKYFNFFNDSFRAIFDRFNVFYAVPAFHVLLPVGISFYTFQTLSYSLDVYRGQRKPEKNLWLFALYVSFFPQLVAGPIERSTSLLPQLKKKQVFDATRVTSGLRLMLWGFFKKLVIADRVGLYVDAIYNNQIQHSGLTLLLATVLFSFQIYCDFSGYSDIAIGAARMFGIDLMINFKRPYFSQSVRDFWSRWHISLSTWFRDYVYIPLGGNRGSKWRTVGNLMLVFVVSGLWHGANWTFIAWGALHGGYCVISHLSAHARRVWGGAYLMQRFPGGVAVAKMLMTFILINLGWVFFRAPSLTDAFEILGKLARFQGPLFINEPLKLLYGIMGIVFLLLIEWRQEATGNGKIPLLESRTEGVRLVTYVVIIITILLTGVFDGGQFLYFQF